MDDQSYYKKKNMEYTLHLRELLTELPPFVKDYFRAKEQTTSAKTRLSYAYDLRVFFQYLVANHSMFRKAGLSGITLVMLDQLQAYDIEEYQEYLKVYESNDKIQTNTEKGIARKMSSLRSFFNYFYKRQALHANPALLVDMPKLHEKSIIRLQPDEVALLLDEIEQYGDQLDGQKKRYYEKTKCRDIAIITLLLGTGIRVSECVGLNQNDISFRNNSLRVTRKGGNESVLYFGAEVEEALYDYIETQRKGITPLAGHEAALFLSMQRKRISVDAVEDIVKKYASAFIPNKHITPHKLRSTYGTTLYQETGDIYLVADVLGHKDVNTTRKHYAALEDDQRRKAAHVVRLREKREK